MVWASVEGNPKELWEEGPVQGQAASPVGEARSNVCAPISSAFKVNLH